MFEWLMMVFASKKKAQRIEPFIPVRPPNPANKIELPWGPTGNSDLVKTHRVSAAKPNPDTRPSRMHNSMTCNLAYVTHAQLNNTDAIYERVHTLPSSSGSDDSRDTRGDSNCD